MKRITHTPNQVKKLTANKKLTHAANEREIIYACAFTREGLRPSSMLKFARFFLGVTFKMASNYVRDEIRAAVREEVSRMLGSSRTEREVSEGISPSTSLVNLRPSERTLSFEEFYEKREEDRQNGFKPPRKKMRGSHSKGQKSTEKSTNVEIKVGLAAQTDGVIKLRRGKTQIITVNSLANKEDIMQKAKAKHASFDQSFDDTLQYSLLYPDFREVVNVPGTNEKFQLSTYKQAIGKEFKRLTFYLIPVDDFTDMSDESDSEAAAKPVKESHLCEFFSGACPKREAKRDVTGSSDDGNDDKEIREMDRCPWDASEPGTSDQRTGRQHLFFNL